MRTRIKITVSSNRVSREIFLAMKIAEDLIKELDNPNYTRYYSNEDIIRINNRSNGEIKHLICSAFQIIVNRKVGYKPMFIITNSEFQKKLIAIIPI